MSGITAISAAKTHGAGSTAVDTAVAGYLVNERISLATSPAGSGYVWSLSAPNDSAPARSALDDDTDAGPSFLPDVPGYYVVSVVVDGATTYVLRIAVAPVATVRICEVIHLLPLANSQVATPQVGVSLYYSIDDAAPVAKDSTGTVTALY